MQKNNILLTEHENKIFDLLRVNGCFETFPFIENGQSCEVNSFEELLFHAVYGYETFSLIMQNNRHYAKREIEIVELILQYQKEMCAFQAPIKLHMTISECEISKYSLEKKRGLLNKSYKKNRGLYFIPALRGYISTHLYENPIIVKGEGRDGHKGCGMYRKERVYGKLNRVLPATLGYTSIPIKSFKYPYAFINSHGNRTECIAESIFKVYEMAVLHPTGFELLSDRTFYSSQEKRTVKRLKKGF